MTQFHTHFLSKKHSHTHQYTLYKRTDGIKILHIIAVETVSQSLMVQWSDHCGGSGMLDAQSLICMNRRQLKKLYGLSLRSLTRPLTFTAASSSPVAAVSLSSSLIWICWFPLIHTSSFSSSCSVIPPLISDCRLHQRLLSLVIQRLTNCPL